MAKDEFHFRFAVGSPQGVRSSIWRIWTSKRPKSDVYVAVRNIAGMMKISFHESGSWRAAFTYEFAMSEFPQANDIADMRLIERWKRPDEISPGVTLAFRIIIPTTHLEHQSIPSSDVPKIHWIDPPDEQDLVEIAVVMTQPGVGTAGWPAKNSMKSKFLAKAELANGQILWLVYLYNKATDEWYRDRDRVRDQILACKPKIANLVGMIRSKNPRIIVGGSFPDGSRYYIDLAAKKLLTHSGYLRLMVSMAITRFANSLRSILDKLVG